MTIETFCRRGVVPMMTQPPMLSTSVTIKQEEPLNMQMLNESSPNASQLQMLGFNSKNSMMPSRHPLLFSHQPQISPSALAAVANSRAAANLRLSPKHIAREHGGSPSPPISNLLMNSTNSGSNSRHSPRPKNPSRSPPLNLRSISHLDNSSPHQTSPEQIISNNTRPKFMITDILRGSSGSPKALLDHIHSGDPRQMDDLQSSHEGDFEPDDNNPDDDDEDDEMDYASKIFSYNFFQILLL